MFPSIQRALPASVSQQSQHNPFEYSPANFTTREDLLPAADGSNGASKQGGVGSPLSDSDCGFGCASSHSTALKLSHDLSATQGIDTKRLLRLLGLITAEDSTLHHDNQHSSSTVLFWNVMRYVYMVY